MGGLRNIKCLSSHGQIPVTCTIIVVSMYAGCWMACSEQETLIFQTQLLLAPSLLSLLSPFSNTHILERSPQIVPENLPTLILYFLPTLLVLRLALEG